MTKPTLPEVAAGDQSWDAQYETWRDVFNDQGYPLATYADFTAWDAVKAQREETLAVVEANDDGDYTGPVLVYGNDGTTTKKVAFQATEVADLTDNSGGSSGGDTIAAITDPADTPASADALRDDLVANTIPEIKDAIATLAEKLNDHLAAQKDTGGMAST